MMTDENSLIGKQIGNYRVVAEINSGAFGSVYQAQHIILRERIVAIKLLHAYLSSPKEREQFLQEAQFLEKLKHPYCLPIIDAGIHNGLPYVVSEYAMNGSLRNHLTRQSSHTLPMEEALTILTQIGQALQHAHQQNIIHRDLKPENILFNAKGDALLADFGIAIVLATSSVRQVDATGTPAYMAPEQFRGMISKESDQYALGCIAYELFTGHRPFTAADFVAIGFLHAAEPPLAPTHYNPQLPIHTGQAILKAMAKQRADRYPDIAGFITALKASTTEQAQALGTPEAEIPTVLSTRVSTLVQTSSPGVSQRSKEQWMQEGNTLRGLKRSQEALAAYEQAIRLDPSYALAYYNKGNALRDLLHYQEALAAYEQAIHLNPNYALAYYNKGNALYDLERYQEALAAFEQAIHLDPNFAAAYNNKGTALSALKRYQEALAAYEQAIHLNPNYAGVHYNKGNALYDLKRYQEALAAYEQAIHLDPNFAAAYNGKGNALRNLLYYQEALAAFEQAIHLNPNYAGVHYNKGNALRDLERYQEALAAYEQAIHLNPNYALAYHNKGRSLEALRKNKEAQQAYERARQLGYSS